VSPGAPTTFTVEPSCVRRVDGSAAPPAPPSTDSVVRDAEAVKAWIPAERVRHAAQKLRPPFEVVLDATASGETLS
jgi:hypothetical protein